MRLSLTTLARITRLQVSGNYLLIGGAGTLKVFTLPGLQP